MLPGRSGSAGVRVADYHDALQRRQPRIGGLLAFYSIIHLPRVDVGRALVEFHRVLGPGGRILLSAHEGHNEVERDEFLEERVPFIATFFELDELVAAMTTARFDVTIAERRPSYDSESGTVRLYLEAERH